MKKQIQRLFWVALMLIWSADVQAQVASWDFEDQELGDWVLQTDLANNYSTTGEITDEQAFDGTYSVRLTVGDDATNGALMNDVQEVMPGDVISFHVWVPGDQVGAINGLQPFLQHGDGWTWVDQWFGASELTPDAWNRIELVVPEDAGTTQRIGIQVTGTDVAATATVYVDEASILREGTAAEAGDLPGRFVLEQNYPNPFNPSTTISYTLGERARVTLTVFNVLGQHVATLVDGVQSAGSHRVTFSGDDLNSGVYLYRLDAGDQVETRQMLLMK